MKKIFFLSGLPRSGSTLLLNILGQNNNIHVEGNSALGQLVYDIDQSFSINAKEQLLASNKNNLCNETINFLINRYYPVEKYVVDKNRCWTIEENFYLIKKYITNDPKIIVLYRSIEDITKSFINIGGWKKNMNFDSFYSDLFAPGSDPLMKPLSGLLSGFINNNSNNFLYISYNDLIYDTKSVLEKIYIFLNINIFNHNTNKVNQILFENDLVYGIKDMHTIREKIEHKKNEIILPKNVLNYCNFLNEKMMEKINEN